MSCSEQGKILVNSLIDKAYRHQRSESGYLSFLKHVGPIYSAEIEVEACKVRSVYNDITPREEGDLSFGQNIRHYKVVLNDYHVMDGLREYRKYNDIEKGSSLTSKGNDLCAPIPSREFYGMGFKEFGVEWLEGSWRSPEICVRDLFARGIAPEQFFDLYKESMTKQLLSIREQTHKNIYEAKMIKAFAVLDTDNGFYQNSGEAQYDFPLVPVGAGVAVGLPTYEALEWLATRYLDENADQFAIGKGSFGEPLFPLVMSARTKDRFIRAIIGQYTNGITQVNYNAFQDFLPQIYAGYQYDRVGRFILIVDNMATRLKNVGGRLERLVSHYHTDDQVCGTRMDKNPEYTAIGPDYYDTISIPSVSSWKKLVSKMGFMNNIGGLPFGNTLDFTGNYNALSVPEFEIFYKNFDTPCNEERTKGYLKAIHRFGIKHMNDFPGVQLAVSSGGYAGMFTYEKSEECPPVVTQCNRVDVVCDTCPRLTCPLKPLATKPGFYEVSFSIAPTPAFAAGASVELLTQAGTPYTATVDTTNFVSPDGKTYVLDFGGNVDVNAFTSLLCSVEKYCSSAVLGQRACIKDPTADPRAFIIETVDLLKVAVGDIIKVRHACNNIAEYTVTDINETLKCYTIVPVAAASDNGKCPVGIAQFACVVPTVANGCPECEPTLQLCDGTSVPDARSACSGCDTPAVPATEVVKKKSTKA